MYRCQCQQHTDDFDDEPTYDVTIITPSETEMIYTWCRHCRTTFMLHYFTAIEYIITTVRRV